MSRVWSGVGFAVLVASALGRVFAQQLPPEPPVELAVRAALQPTAVQQAECLAGGTARVERHRVTGAVRFLGGDPGQPLGRQVQAGRTVTPEVAAQEFLAVCGSLFGASGLESDLSVAKTRALPDRRSVVRLQQRHQGIPVFGGELIVNLNADQTVLSVSGELLPSPLVSSTIPAVTAAVAADQALAAAAKWHDVPVTELVRAEPELWIYSPGLVGPDTGAPRLVWRTEVTSQALRPIRELVLVDAERGSVALHFNQIDTVLSRQTYTTANTTTLPGTLVCTEADPSCAAGDAHAAGAHLSAADTYNFYQSVHGRDSINNAGLIMKSTVHYGSVYVNAFWNGSQMVYGDGAGFPPADDVVGHELTPRRHATRVEPLLLLPIWRHQRVSLRRLGEFVDQSNGAGTTRRPSSG